MQYLELLFRSYSANSKMLIHNNLVWFAAASRFLYLPFIKQVKSVLEFLIFNHLITFCELFISLTKLAEMILDNSDFLFLDSLTFHLHYLESFLIVALFNVSTNKYFSPFQLFRNLPNYLKWPERVSRFILSFILYLENLQLKVTNELLTVHTNQVKG